MIGKESVKQPKYPRSVKSASPRFSINIQDELGAVLRPGFARPNCRFGCLPWVLGPGVLACPFRQSAITYKRGERQSGTACFLRFFGTDEQARRVCYTTVGQAGISMANPFEDPSGTYLILVNSDGQHSLWPAFRLPPEGWSPVGPAGRREQCLDWIEAHWTDMRPISLRAQ